MTADPDRVPRIVVGFDGSDDAISALEFAADEARGRQADLYVVHAIDDSVLNSAWGIVFDLDAYRKTGEGLIDQAREIAASRGIQGDRFRGEVLVGQPTSVLLEAAQEASIVVVGRRAEPGQTRQFVGSTAVGLAGQAVAPLVVLSKWARPEARGLVSVALDSTRSGSQSVEWGFLRAERLGVRLQVVSLVSRPRGPFFALNGTTDEQMDAAAAEVRRRVDALLKPFRERHPAVDVTVSVRKVDSTVEELLSVSDASDFLIIGVHTGFPTYSAGGTVRALMAHAGCPLGIVRQR